MQKTNIKTIYITVVRNKKKKQLTYVYIQKQNFLIILPVFVILMILMMIVKIMINFML